MLQIYLDFLTNDDATKLWISSIMNYRIMRSIYIFQNINYKKNFIKIYNHH